VVGDRRVPPLHLLVVHRALETDHRIERRELDRAGQIGLRAMRFAFDLRAAEAEPRAVHRDVGRERAGPLLVFGGPLVPMERAEHLGPLVMKLGAIDVRDRRARSKDPRPEPGRSTPSTLHGRSRSIA
jgi:hypothetical protein